MSKDSQVSTSENWTKERDKAACAHRGQSTDDGCLDAMYSFKAGYDTAWAKAQGETREFEQQCATSAHAVVALIEQRDALEAQVRKLEGERDGAEDCAVGSALLLVAANGQRDQWRDRALKLKEALERIAEIDDPTSPPSCEPIYCIASEALAEFEETTKTKG